jgi:hypothetical protein
VQVWDPKDKPTVFRRIKKAIEARTGLLMVTRYIIYPGILFILVFVMFALLPGCATMKWPWEKEVPMMNDDPDAVSATEFICTKIDCGDEDIDKLVADEKNTIACIKLQPECNLDVEN